MNGCEFNVNFTRKGLMKNKSYSAGPSRQAGTMAMRGMALVARMKLAYNMAAGELNPGPELRSPGCLRLSYSIRSS